MYCFLCEGIYVTVCYRGFTNLLQFVTYLRYAVTFCNMRVFAGERMYTAGLIGEVCTRCVRYGSGLSRSDYPQFRRDIQEAFSVAVVEEFGDQGGEPIPSDAELNAAFAAQGTLVFHVVSGDVRVGGVVVEIHPETRLSGCFRIRWCGRR